MSATFDTTTKTAYDAATTAADRATAIVASLSSGGSPQGAVRVKVFNGASPDTEMGSGTMSAPWATASGGTVVIGEVSSFSVGTTGTPNANWYIRFQTLDGTRWAKGSFGLSSSTQDFKWSLSSWEDGQTGTIGTATIVCSGNSAPVFTVAPTSATIPNTGGTIQFTAVDPDGGTIIYSLPTTRNGITINSTTGLVTVTSAAADTSGQVVVEASDGSLSATTSVGVTVTSDAAAVNTVFSDLSLVVMSDYQSIGNYNSGITYRFDGTDQQTQQAFSATSPQLWGGQDSFCDYQVLDGKRGSVADAWQIEFRRDLAGPDGANRLLRVTRKTGYVQPQYAAWSIWPKAGYATQGMVYIRQKIRLDPTWLNVFTGWSTLVGAKFNGGAEADPRISLAFSYDSSFGFILQLGASASTVGLTPVYPWAGVNINSLTPRPYSYWAPSGEFSSLGVIAPASSTPAPPPSWGSWWTIEYACRAQDIVSGRVAGNGAAGWVWVATSQGTSSAAAANGSGTTRFSIPGPNVFKDPEVNYYYLLTYYMANSIANKWIDYGRMEIYPFWPSDASPHPAEYT